MAACSDPSWVAEQLIVRVVVDTERGGARLRPPVVPRRAGHRRTNHGRARGARGGLHVRRRCDGRGRRPSAGARSPSIPVPRRRRARRVEGLRGPVRVGRLHVRPSWLEPHDDPPAAGERCVLLDPSRAFGSGSHPSTVACLAAVDRWVGAGTSVLDVGCGSGVLAVAAAALGVSPVVAVDVDPGAVAATAANATANGVVVDARVGSADAVEGRFDLVLANIGAATIVELAPALGERLERRAVPRRGRVPRLQSRRRRWLLRTGGACRRRPPRRRWLGLGHGADPPLSSRRRGHAFPSQPQTRGAG